MKETKCCYANDANVCTILMNEYCTGYKSICSFRKTEQEHIDAVNEAISINRAKGNCDKCRYRDVRCQLREENEG